MSKQITELLKGPWSALTAYTIGDIVTSNGSSYICIVNHTNHIPPNAIYWTLLAQGGVDGETTLSTVQTFTGLKTFGAGLLKLVDIIDAIQGLKVLVFAGVASAVNWIKITSAATGNSPEIKPDGSDTNIDLSIIGKGTGKVKFGTANIKLPNSDGSNGQVLQTNGSGIVSFGNGFADGWIPTGETWTYASPSTITVPTGAASRYDVGDKIKFTQSGLKYFYITAVADTVLTVNGGTDYVVVNAAITSPSYSKVASPNGFPQWFNFTSANRDWDSTDPTTVSVSNEKFTLNGRMCTVIGRIIYTNAGTTNTQFQCDMPIPANQASAKYHTMALASMSPNQDDAFLSTAGQAQAILFSTIPTLIAKLTTGSMSAKAVWYNATYQI